LSVNPKTDFFGILANHEYVIDPEKLDIIKIHVKNFAEYLPNIMMLNRLEQALNSGQKISGADASFYFHELKEAEFMKEGYDYYEAHQGSINYYSVSPYSLYHPEVIKACPDDFNRNWRKAWEID
jgi:hypothetical protein